MQIGLLTDSLSTMTRAEALDTAAALGVQTVEIGLGGAHGGWSPAPHADLAELLTDAAARDTLRRDITSRGLRLEAFNAAGNPLHPVEGDRDDRVLRGALRLAEEFEVGTVVTMSGLPANPGDTFPAWITTVWPPENLRLLEHQWTVAVDYWGDLAAEAQRRGVRIAVEMHANQLVYGVPGLLKLREAVGDTVGANVDPSHLLWMGADPIAAIGALSDNSWGSHPPRPRQGHPHRGARRRRIPARNDPQRADGRASLELRRRRQRSPRRRRLLGPVRHRTACRRLRRPPVDRERGLHPRPTRVRRPRCHYPPRSPHRAANRHFSPRGPDRA